MDDAQKICEWQIAEEAKRTQEAFEAQLKAIRDAEAAAQRAAEEAARSGNG